MHTIILNGVSFCCNEISSPVDGWHEVVNAHSLCLRGIFLLGFCSVEIIIGNTLPKDNPPPECTRILGCTTNNASICHFKITLLLDLRVSESLHAPLMYRIRCTNLTQSSSSGNHAFAVRNTMTVQVSGLALLVAYKVFATILCNSTTFY